MLENTLLADNKCRIENIRQYQLAPSAEEHNHSPDELTSIHDCRTCLTVISCLVKSKGFVEFVVCSVLNI